MQVEESKLENGQTGQLTGEGQQLPSILRKESEVMRIMNNIAKNSNQPNEGHFLNPQNHKANRRMLAVPTPRNRNESSNVRRKTLTPAILDTIQQEQDEESKQDSS